MFVLIAACVDHFEVFCTTDRGERIGTTVREQILCCDTNRMSHPANQIPLRFDFNQ